jgi:hypothetical protein
MRGEEREGEQRSKRVREENCTCKKERKASESASEQASAGLQAALCRACAPRLQRPARCLPLLFARLLRLLTHQIGGERAGVVRQNKRASEMKAIPTTISTRRKSHETWMAMCFLNNWVRLCCCCCRCASPTRNDGESDSPCCKALPLSQNCIFTSQSHTNRRSLSPRTHPARISREYLAPRA